MMTLTVELFINYRDAELLTNIIYQDDIMAEPMIWV